MARGIAIALCEASDAAALWAIARLQSKGFGIEIIFADVLGSAKRIEHRLEESGSYVRIELVDGRVLSSDSPIPIFNRMNYVPTQSLRVGLGADFSYAVQELFALYLSMLHAWPTAVVNRPAPQGLNGAYRHTAVWRSMALSAGLSIQSWQQSDSDSSQLPEQSSLTRRTVFVVGERTVSPPGCPRTLDEPCRRLARASGSQLLGLDFIEREEEWVFVSASSSPNLFLGGEPLVDVIAEQLS